MIEPPKVQTIKTLKSSLSKRPKITVVIPIRNISGPRIKNCIRSLQLQNLKSFTTIIADYGSKGRELKKLMKALKNFDCTVYRYKTNEVWSLSVARNIGIRRATGKIVVTIDADLILEPNVLKAIVKRHRDVENPFVVSTVCDLDRKIVNLETIRLPEDYKKFRKTCEPRFGIGGVMSAPLEWWHHARGFDERMRGWGVEDDDIRKRAKRDTRQIRSIQVLDMSLIKVYHQWHNKWSDLDRCTQKKLWLENCQIYKESSTVVRNDENWGLWNEDQLCSEYME